jgi:hypothetical protein
VGSIYVLTSQHIVGSIFHSYISINSFVVIEKYIFSYISFMNLICSRIITFISKQSVGSLLFNSSIPQ